jgi:hypothetical protein
MTPSARIITTATETRTVTDGQGRLLEIRHLNALDRLRLFKAAGPLLVQNEAWLGMALLATSVIAVDGVPIPQPTNELQIEGVVGRLGNVGIAAVADALDTPAGQETAELVASAGNCHGTPT